MCIYIYTYTHTYEWEDMLMIDTISMCEWFIYIYIDVIWMMMSIYVNIWMMMSLCWYMNDVFNFCYIAIEMAIKTVDLSINHGDFP